MPPRPRPFWSQVDKSGDCWLWTTARAAGGYGHVRFRGRMQKAHRVAWTLTLGEIPEGMNVLHRCDNPPCVRPDHLFLGTILDNNKDRHAKGRTKSHFCTIRNPRRKLSDRDRLEIARLRKSGVKRAAVAAMYGIRESTVKQSVRLARDLVEQLAEDAQ